MPTNRYHRLAYTIVLGFCFCLLFFFPPVSVRVVALVAVVVVVGGSGGGGSGGADSVPCVLISMKSYSSSFSM